MSRARSRLLAALAFAARVRLIFAWLKAARAPSAPAPKSTCTDSQTQKCLPGESNPSIISQLQAFILHSRCSVSASHRELVQPHKYFRAASWKLSFSFVVIDIH